MRKGLCQPQLRISLPQATAIEDGGGNRSGSFPTFREWLAEQKSRPEERS